VATTPTRPRQLQGSRLPCLVAFQVDLWLISDLSLQMLEPMAPFSADPPILPGFRLPRLFPSAAGPIALAGADVLTILLYLNLSRCWVSGSPGQEVFRTSTKKGR
jgi:hypothetical protein